MSKYPNSLLLDSLNIPRFSTIGELSRLIGLSEQLLYCLSTKTERYYKTVFIPKRKGGKREISIPSYTLHLVQRWILVNILNNLMPTKQAMAFRKGKAFGVKQNAKHHGTTLFGMAVDLKDFFPSVTANKVYTIFSDLGYDRLGATILTNLCTLNGKLPQGSACSPALSNLTCINLDKRLAGLCEKRGVIYTRYADDMYFSCDDKALLLRYFPVITDIIEDEGFAINDRKLHFHTPSNRKRITGITVVRTANHEEFELKAPKEMKRKIRAELFKCIMSGDYTARDHIRGEISYICYVEQSNAHDYLAVTKGYIDKLGEKIRYFPELVDAYNENLFFKDLSPKAPLDVAPSTVEEVEAFAQQYSLRKEYLEKTGVKDICTYSHWPREIVSRDPRTEDGF